MDPSGLGTASQQWITFSLFIVWSKKITKIVLKKSRIGFLHALKCFWVIVCHFQWFWMNFKILDFLIKLPVKNHCNMISRLRKDNWKNWSKKREKTISGECYHKDASLVAQGSLLSLFYRLMSYHKKQVNIEEEEPKYLSHWNQLFLKIDIIINHFFLHL